MKKLTEFPSTGWCKSLDERLIKFIKNKYPNYNLYDPIKNHIDIAWNITSFWYIQKESGQLLYELEQLEPFFQQKNHQYEVVHCTTKQEWDFVREKTTSKHSKEWDEAILKYEDIGIGLHFNGYGWGDLNWFKQQNSLILSFQEWCRKFNHHFLYKKEYEIGKWSKDTYVVFIKGCFGTYKDSNELPIGKVNKIIKEYANETISVEKSQFWIYKSNCEWFATLQEAESFSKTLNNSQEDLLEIAKKKYPIGTKIYSALKSDNNPCQTTVKIYSLDFVNGRKVIWAGLEGFIYDDGKWAEIIEEETLLEKAKRLYPVGTKFKNIYGKPSENVVSEMDHDFESVHIIPDNITVSVKYPEECLKWSIYSKEKGWAEILPQSKNEEIIDKTLVKQNPVTIKESFSLKPQLIQVKQLQILN